MADPLNVNLVMDYRLEAYSTIFNHAWAKRLLMMADGTKLDPPLFELMLNWRAAVNTHGFPWMMMKALEGLWQGHLKDNGCTSKLLRAMTDKIAQRMGNMTHTGRQRLTQVVKELADEILTGVENDPESDMDANDMWKHFQHPAMVELHVAIWGSQRFCFGALYHAYENYFREVLAIKKGDPNYKFHRFSQLVEHTTEEFGSDIADKCLNGEFLDITRWIRNSLAHNGGKENQDLINHRKKKDHGIPVESGYLQIMPPDNERLISALQRRVTILTEAALKLPEFHHSPPAELAVPVLS